MSLPFIIIWILAFVLVAAVVYGVVEHLLRIPDPYRWVVYLVVVLIFLLILLLNSGMGQRISLLGWV